MSYSLTKMKLTNYKNYENLEISFHQKLNAILGLNGMGKTNILDAIYYSCIGKSYFSSGDRNVVKHHSDFIRIESYFDINDTEEIFIAKVIPAKSKELIINGKKINRISEYVGRHPVVIIAPSDIQLLLEGSEERRKYLNQTIMQYDRKYAECLLEYNRLLKQRNALLKKLADEKKWDRTLLEILTERMNTPARYVYNKRLEVINKKASIFENLYAKISGSHESCTINYKSHLSQNDLIPLHQESLEKDRILARTTRGVHKDDILFYMNDELLKPFGSQGQLKSFILALKLTQYQILKENNNHKPILLLDDLFDKLDKLRVEKILEILHEDIYGQVFITDKDEEDIPTFLEKISSDYYIFAINEGALKYCKKAR